jgi:crotonobetainyl-CoA:carnitine CoA-transferase CaiB-like acyl-CoA transferase
MLSISGFGREGDDAGRAAYAPVIHAEAGLIGRQADKLRARARVMAGWFAAHPDRDALKRDLETARLAWADIRHAGDVLAAPSVAGRDTIVEVTDGDGEKRSVARMPYRFSDAASGPVRGVPEPGEHTEDILRDWTGRPDLPAPGAPPSPAPSAPLTRAVRPTLTRAMRLSPWSHISRSRRRSPAGPVPGNHDDATSWCT